MSKSPDLWRSQVYSAEDQFSALLNRGGSVDFFGSILDVPTQRRFGDLDTVREYVNRVFDSVAVTHAGIEPPLIRQRKGSKSAHYDYSVKTIAIPIDDQWALRESVILHECAHHLTWFVHSEDVAPHGPEFTSLMLFLVELMLGEAAALLLRAGYQEAGVPINISEVRK